MKNSYFIVYPSTRNGATTRFVRDSRGRVQTAPSGIKHRCTAEQVLNSLLPALVLGDSVIRTRVVLRRGRRFNPPLERL
jgi:hypothetical protein